MSVPVVHGIVTILTEAYQVPRDVGHLRVMFHRKDVVNMLSLPEPPVPLALLTHIMIAPENRLPEAFPFC